MRVERVVGYNRMVKRAMVEGVRRVFTNQFAERQLRDLRVASTFPMTKADYPSVYVEFIEGANVNAGVGHSEMFYDVNGVLRRWNHRLFDGSIRFNVLALSSVDRDILGDAIVEMLAFSGMPEMSLQHNLFTHIYGDPDGISPDLRQTLSHLAYDSDVIRPGGESVSPVFWGSEDDLAYEKSYSVNVTGGFYNSYPSDVVGPDFITHAFVYPKLADQVALPIWQSDSDWMPDIEGGAIDANTVTATASVSAE